MYFSKKEKSIISVALQLLWKERGLNNLPMDENGNYYDYDFPDDVNLANTIRRLRKYFEQ